MDAKTRTPLPNLNIALVTETFPPEVNGVAMTLGRLVGGLRQGGHRVQVIRPRQALEDPASKDVLLRGLPIPFYPGLRFGLPATATLIRLWQKRRPDIVHVATEGPLGASALKAAKRLGLPVSTGFHTNFDAYCRHYGLGWLARPIAAHLRRFHNRSDATLVPTRNLASVLRTNGYRNVDVVSRGVDTRLFNPGRRSAALRASWGAASDDLVAMYVGRLAPEKNLGLALAAFDAIKRRQPRARMVFVGDGPARSRLAANAGAHFFAGIHQGEDLAAHYASADIFLFPSLTETFGNVTLEAMASGLGVVAYDCAAAADLIEDRVNGCLAAPGDEAGFIAAAVALAAEPSMLREIRALTQASVAHLDWERIHERFARLLWQVVQCEERKNHVQGTFVVAPD